MTDIPQEVKDQIRIPGAFEGSQLEDLPTGLRRRVDRLIADLEPAPDSEE